MKLGTRVTLVTTTVIASVLAVSTYAALKVRRANLEADLGREAHEIAAALRAGIEPVEGSKDEINEMLRHRIRAAREHGELFQLEVLSGGREQRTLDQAWLLLMQAADIEDAPVGRLFDSETGPRSYAMAVPLYDAATLELPRRHPARRPIANIGMRRDTGYIDAEVAATARRIVPLFVIVVIGVALGVRFALRQTVVQPLRRLVEGIDAVGKGDLSRVILAERDDEIGTIAGRFNAMTGSLREAREDGERAASARLNLEERLRHAEKLATIGQMAAEIAHELGTPLNVIGGRARSLSKKAGDAAEVTKNAGLISDEVVRITKIIRQVLDFSRPRGPTLTRVRIGAVVAEALEFVRETVRRVGIKVELGTSPPPPEVPGDPDQIQQVCLNLITNAIHAMPGGGTLRITTEQVVRRKGGLDLSPPAEYVVLSIADTGRGIPAADRDKIFEPFFTTKDAGQGTGLGLAVSNGIVKDHDGWIEVDGPADLTGPSEGPGPPATGSHEQSSRSPTRRGALFRVFLPCAVASGATIPPVEPAPRAEPESMTLAQATSIGKD